MMTTCCYNPQYRGISEKKVCQFNNEKAIKVGDIYLCRFHMPWSSDDLWNRFNVALENGDGSRNELKDKWDEQRKGVFQKDLLKLVQAAHDLTGVVALENFDLSDQVGRLSMPDSVFPGRFHIARPFDDIDMRKAVFVGPVTIGHRVARALDLSGASFLSDFTLAGDKTHGNVRFDGCSFAKRARFRGVRFEGDASFKEVNFNGPAQFEDSLLGFAKTISFDMAVFEGPAYFRTGEVDRRVGRIFFRNSVFKDEVGFEGRHFESSLNFHGCVFHRAPRFQDARISFESVFPRLKGFLDWQRIPAGLPSPNLAGQREYYERAAQAYRTLRYAMKAQEAHEEEGRFWELEMRAKERTLGWDREGWLPKLFFRLYAASSRYGNSIGLPLLFWCLIFLIFVFGYAMFNAGSVVTNVAPALQGIGEFSFHQTIRPFAVWSEEGGQTIRRLVFGVPHLADEGRVLAIRLLATAQSLLSLTCIALFGFALRRRFRMT